MRSGFRKNWDKLNLNIEAAFREYKYTKRGKERVKRMKGGYDCAKEYNEVVLPFWKKYGYKPKQMWYQIFADRDHVVDPRYIPDDLYYGKLVPYFSNTQFRRFGEDKCYHDVWFRDLKRPRTICKNIAGVYYDGDMNIIDGEKAVLLCCDFDSEFLIKPSVDSGEGRLITFFTPGGFTRDEIINAFKTMKANFIVQAVVKQCPTLAKLNPTSLNTIRVVSLLFNNEVHILSTILRMGATNARVDNIGAGGFACPIRQDGWLAEKGVDRKAEWRTENQNGIKFAEIQVPSFDKIINIIKSTHPRLGHFKLIGWDFSVDNDGDPVFIEFNVCPGSNQITCGPTFGDLTEQVLDEFFIKKTLQNAQN